jgi:hypothetical protein
MGFKAKLHSTLADQGPHGEEFLQSARWYSLGYRIGSGAFAPNTLRTISFPLAKAAQFESIAIRVDVAGDAGSRARTGIYADTGVGYPGKLLFASAELAIDTTGAKRDDGLSIGLAPGIYWLAVIHNSTVGSPQLENLADGLVQIGSIGITPPTQAPQYTGWDFAMAYAVLPDPYPAGANNVSPTPRIYLKTG